MPTITLDDLCAVAAPRAAFPSGAPSWQAVVSHLDCPAWLRGQIAARAPGLTLAERLEAAE